MDPFESSVSWRKRPSVKSVQELLAMAHDRSREGREFLVTAAGEFIAEENGVLNEKERALMTDILNRLVKEVEVSVRQKLAQRLADAENAPHTLIVELANDEIEIAAPVLNRSKVLKDIDLIEVVRHKTLEHQLAVAVRESIAAPVSDALVQSGNPDVVETLLKNKGAALAPETLETVIEQSRERRNYQEPLLQREELGPELAKRMYWWVSAALRSSILDRYDLDPESFDDSMEDVVHETLAEAGVDAGRKAPETLAALLKIDEVAQSELVKALREGDITKFQSLIQKATGLGLPLLRVLLFEPGGERLAIVCRAIEMAPKVFAAIYRLLRMSSDGATPLKRGELTRIASLYLDINPDLALAVLRQWRRNPDYLAAIAQVTGKPARLS